MREQFEKLPHISLVIGFLKFSEDSNDYIRIDDRIDNYALGLVNGAWYAFQEQQEKIARLQSALDDLKKTCNDVLDLGVSNEFERGWGCAHRRVLCGIEAIIGADQ